MTNVSQSRRSVLTPTPFSTKVVKTRDVLALRTKILRPGFAEGQLASMPGDDDDATFHVATYMDDKVVGCASFMQAPSPVDGEAAYQLRGMAVDDATRRRGIGYQIIQVARTELALKGVPQMWCNARETAVDFYLAAGFQVEGDCFDIPNIGPHFLMWTRIQGALA